MKSSPHPARLRRSVLVEAVTVVVSGLLLGLLLNSLSPRGLKLGRNYFPTVLPLANGPATNKAAAAVNPPDPTNAALARLRERGLQPIAQPAVVARFHESQRTPGAVIFVDARSDALYQAGHIPGAHQLDYYRPEAYLPDVLAACAAAQQIVVYCTGGECEDSELAATLLTQVGVPAQRLFVYSGGYTDWAASGLPVETGGRLSGILKGGGP